MTLKRQPHLEMVEPIRQKSWCKEMTKARSYRPNIALSLILALTYLSVGCASDADLRDDAYSYMKNGINDQLYNEWWYFNGVDNKTQFMLTFLISDPDNLTSSRIIQVQAVILQEGQLPLLGSQKSQGFGADRSLPMFDIDRSGFSSDQEGDFNVWGEVIDLTSGERVKWDLVYQPSASPWYAIPTQAKVGLSGSDPSGSDPSDSDPWGWIKWLVYMPSANVTGSFTIGNRTMDFNGTGYHDHIWGRFPGGKLEATWAQVSDPANKFSLSYREVLGDKKEAYLGVEKDGKAIEFSGRQVKTNYTDYAEYAFDNATGVYPAQYNISADNGDWSLNFIVQVEKSIPTVIDYPHPLTDRLDLQQIALIEGTLRSKSGEEYSFKELGFSGYATEWLDPVYDAVDSLDEIN